MVENAHEPLSLAVPQGRARDITKFEGALRRKAQESKTQSRIVTLSSLQSFHSTQIKPALNLLASCPMPASSLTLSSLRSPDQKQVARLFSGLVVAAPRALRSNLGTHTHQSIIHVRYAVDAAQGQEAHERHKVKFFIFSSSACRFKAGVSKPGPKLASLLWQPHQQPQMVIILLQQCNPPLSHCRHPTCMKQRCTEPMSHLNTMMVNDEKWQKRASDACRCIRSGCSLAQGHGPARQGCAGLHCALRGPTHGER